MKRAAALAGGLLLAGCFPSLEEYGACADGACGGSTGLSTSGTQSTGNTTGSTGTEATSAGSSSGGGSSTTTTSSGEGAGGGSTSSSGGGGAGGGGNPCLAPQDLPLVQDGALIEGESLGTPYAFCIDRAEVTHQAYRAFWQEVNGGDFDPTAILASRDECSWKGTDAEALVPEFGDMFQSDWDNTTNPLLPMVGIDWCDALAYCSFAGKRLCGGIEGDAVPYKAQQTRNEWYLACSNGDQRSFCYAEDGDNQPSGCVDGAGTEASCPAYDPAACASNADCGGWRGLWEETESATCAAAASSALVNLSGNVAEWVDACEEIDGLPGEYRCEARGGSCPMRTYTSCHWAGQDVENPVGSRGNYGGFRCCWDPE